MKLLSSYSVGLAADKGRFPQNHGNKTGVKQIGFACNEHDTYKPTSFEACRPYLKPLLGLNARQLVGYYLVEKLFAESGNKPKVASQAGMALKTLYNKLNELIAENPEMDLWVKDASKKTRTVF